MGRLHLDFLCRLVMVPAAPIDAPPLGELSAELIEGALPSGRGGVAASGPPFRAAPSVSPPAIHLPQGGRI